MLKLNKPDDSASDIFSNCIGNTRDAALKARLVGVTAIVASDSDQFNQSATNSTLHTIPQHTNVGGTVTAKEMVTVYEQKLVKTKSPGRPTYDKLLLIPAQGRCPFCGVRSVSTLDHYLPKTLYPSLAVTPTNLVACCRDCNDTKDVDVPQIDGSRILHPYYDDIEGEEWLYAEIIESSPASLSFSVIPPGTWNDEQAIAVRHHFATLQLGKLYASNSADEIVAIRGSLRELFSSGGPEPVRAHLAAQARSRRAARLNWWNSAAYVAMKDSAWFCNGGFMA